MVPFKYCLFFSFWLCHEHNSLQLGPILPSSPCIKELHGFKNMRIKFATADFLGTEQSRVNAFWRNGEEEVGSKLMWVDRTSPRTTTTTTTKTFWSQIKFCDRSVKCNVTRLADLWKFLATNCLAKVAQILCGLYGYF